MIMFSLPPTSYYCKYYVFWPSSKVVMQGTANPRSAVRFRAWPPYVVISYCGLLQVVAGAMMHNF